MKIQLINPSKLKILFNLQDLEENNITLHSFLSGSESSKTFLKAIIEIAEEDLGLKNLKENFSYETFCFNYSEFVIIVSSTLNSDISSNDLNQNSINYNTIENIYRDNNVSSNFSFNFIDNKLSKNNLNRKSLFYFFFNIEDFFEFSDYIKNNLKLFKVNSFLYQYQNIFLLEIDISSLPCYELEHLLLVLSETNNCLNFKSNISSYKSSTNISELVITRLKEFSDLLISNNALNL